ncbi:GroES-like protein [Eremomyces bilateralis CBS 781.70]|uniref:GroES-like protein n=1 Tax=Eremomyces bilateralis CBS 781.70 TaxID=1392243 RepID=A0A6G1GCI6_9PEZI|nr:GroES-like protein [Eremomyces bilateralis CBS 781.70]KAF1815808.1 GroES-like protein [Eremomyces bilateralis CBS 781.70]
MRAAQFFGKGDIRVVDVSKPVRKDGEVLIEIENCGVCGSDLAEFTMGPVAVPVPGRPHPLTGETLPVTMGHEFCGRVKEAPANSSLKEGQAVMVDPRIYCGSCTRCQSSATNNCHQFGFHGLSGGGGGFSEFVTVDEKMCYPLPDSVPLEYAALIEPLAVAWHAAKQADLPDFKGKTVLIIGGGPVGIAMVHCLKHFRADKVIVSEPTATRQAQNRTIADVVLDPITQSVPDECRALTKGVGVDVAFDCSGAQPGVDAAMDALRNRGLFINVAAKPIVPPFMHWILKEITLKCTLAYDDKDFGEVVNEFAKGSFNVKSMVTSRISLEDAPKAFSELVNKKDDHIKILISHKY